MAIAEAIPAICDIGHAAAGNEHILSLPLGMRFTD
jgi:hypothetical protein